MSARRPGRTRRALLALAAGSVLALVLLEGGLWIAYALGPAEPRFEPRPEPGIGAPAYGERTILCIGDSHTYGVHLERDESYPGQLQALLDRWEESPWRVVNVGYPGQNSAQVRGRLAREIETSGAEIVICWVGVNNTWSTAGRHLWSTPERESEPGLLERCLQGSRAVKLARMVRNRLAGVSGGMSAQRVRRTLDVDWSRIQAICAEHGARLLTADYPVHIRSTERVVNGALHEIAGRLGIPIVPIHDELLPVFYGLGYEHAMFGDHHANGLGNYAVARRMLAALVAEGFLEDRPEWRGTPEPWERLAGAAIRIARADAERADVRLAGPAGARYRIRLLRLYATDNDKRRQKALPAPWYDASSAEELEQRGLTGVLDGDGRARIDLELPAEPEHPSPTGVRVLWLGWRLRVELETDAGPVELHDRDARADVLLDPAVVHRG